MNFGQGIRKVASISLLLCMFSLSLPGVGSVFAQQGDTGRTKKVNVDVTQYVWRLISYQTGKSLCEVLIEHLGYPSEMEAFTLCTAQIDAAVPSPTPASTGTPSPTQQPVDLTDLTQFGAWRYVETRKFSRTIQVSLPDLIVSISSPPEAIPQPYVLITAYEPVSEYHITSIQGMLGNGAFECSGSPCAVPVRQDTQISFWTRSSSGDESQHASADIRIAITSQGYQVNLTSILPAKTYSDSCANIWGQSQVNLPKWAEFHISPEQLNTKKSLYFLADRLISTGLVNAKDCPGGGLLGYGSPNACGMERAASTLVQWQNQFDPVIWGTSQKIGIPPRLLKSLIEQESQFWPGNSHFYIYEFGLGQLNQIGADVALRYDNDLFKRVCDGLLFDCNIPYASLPSWLQATVRGGLMRTVNAECPNCSSGIDLSTATQSIPIIGQVLRSNCQQTQYISNLIGTHSSYEDMWKFTLVSYHAGYQCLFDSMSEARKYGDPIDWEHIANRLTCGGAVDYVNQVFAALNQFDTFLAKPGAAPPAMQPTFIPTPTPQPSPTPVRAHSTIRVVVYIDTNGDQIPEPSERIDGLNVQVSFPNGSHIERPTQKGEAVFDMTGEPIGITATVTIPALYRISLVTVTQQGEIPVFFRIPPPSLPSHLP